MPLSVHVPAAAAAPPVPSAPAGWRRLAPQGVVESRRPPLGLAQDVADQLEDLLVAVARLGHAGQGGGREALRPLLLHQLVLPLLGLRELGGDDHQAQVDHEERADLEGERGVVLRRVRSTSALSERLLFLLQRAGVQWLKGPTFIFSFFFLLRSQKRCFSGTSTFLR